MSSYILDIVQSPDWCSPQEAAQVFGKSVLTIRRWCAEGTFAELGIPVYHAPHGHWYINIPESKRSKRFKTIQAQP